mmetsp:Transcript_4334/g.10454  ORF Transcript_4334/g.10454 Transcript_4334/m.10454 type:complete len:447 (+) Transcript_4334:14-1354(+)
MPPTVKHRKASQAWRPGRGVTLAALAQGVAGFLQNVEVSTARGELFIDVVRDFGLQEGAEVEVHLEKDMSMPVTNNTYIMMLTSSQRSVWERTSEQPLVNMNDPDIGPHVFGAYLMAYWRQNFYGSEIHFKHRIRGLGRYNLLMFNGGSRTDIVVRGNVSVVNPDGQHLKYQDVFLPEVYRSMMWVCVASAAVAALFLVSLWRMDRSAVHSLMLATLVCKACVDLLQWQAYVACSETGSPCAFYDDPSFAGCIPLLAVKVQEILVLMVYLLLAFGWRILRATLNIAEIRFAVGIGLISFYLAIFEVTCVGTQCGGYEMSRLILHSLAYLCILVAVNFNITQLKQQISESPASQSTGKDYQRLAAYESYRLLLLVYITNPTWQLLIKLSVLSWQEVWAFQLTTELADWGLAVALLIIFRPQKNMQIFELTTPEEDEQVPVQPAEGQE